MLEQLTKAQLIKITRHITGSGRDYARLKKRDFVRIVGELDPADVANAIKVLNYNKVWRNGLDAHVEVSSPELAHPVSKKPASAVFKGAVRGSQAGLKGIEVEVWNSKDAPVIDPLYIFDGKLLQFALAGIETGTNVWFGGPASTGKTEFAKNLAAYLGRPFVRVSFDASAEKFELIGGERMRNGSTVYQDGLVLQGIVQPGALILLDEPSFGRPEYLSTLHAILEPGGEFNITETGRKVKKANGVVFLAADNSLGRGDYSGQYAGVREMNSAFLSRFPIKLEFSYLSPSVESRVIAARSGCSPALAGLLTGFLTVCRASAAASKLVAPPTLREMFALARLLVMGLPPRDSFVVTVVNGSPVECHEELQQLWTANVNEASIASAIGSVEQFSDSDDCNPVEEMLVSEIKKANLV